MYSTMYPTTRHHITFAYLLPTTIFAHSVYDMTHAHHPKYDDNNNKKENIEKKIVRNPRHTGKQSQ